MISKLALSTWTGSLKPRNLAIKPILFRSFKTQTNKPAESVRKAYRSVGAEASGAIPKSFAPIQIGLLAVAGTSVLGLGALAFYGTGMSKEAGLIDRVNVWPEYVKQRIRSTYTYFGASLGLTAGSVYAISRSPAMMRLLTRNTMMSMFASIALCIGSGALVRSIPYESVVPKHMAWAAHVAILGALVAPMVAIGGSALMIRAAWYTAGVVGGLTTIAATAPSEKFLNMGAPLAIGMGTVFAASIGTFFLPPTTTLALSLYSISLYGGLILFSGFLLYDTQRIVHKAERNEHFDPINESVSIYLDTLNIFIRLVSILSGSKRK